MATFAETGRQKTENRSKKEKGESKIKSNKTELSRAKVIEIDLDNYDYDLPEGKIAQYPLKERDDSKLLLYDGKSISSSLFSDIDKFISPGSLLVFNNTRVIRARLLFHKESGANIEVLCLEPISPADYETSFGSTGQVEWKCIIGNLKKWKTGLICLEFDFNFKKNRLCAEKICQEGDTWRVRFTWDNAKISFGEVLEATGHIPLPPYINREDEPDDIYRYQTIYSSIRGSVAAPTAGLHFTKNIFKKLSRKGIRHTEITLHVGAGTFQPVKSRNISGHEMHCEHFFLSKVTLRMLIENREPLIAVGTTSVRTIESLYWLGIKALKHLTALKDGLVVSQWEPYNNDTTISPEASLTALYDLMVKKEQEFIAASTKLIIVPGYKFRMVDGIITNFHQPRSTLLLLVSAWTGPEWKNIYNYALEHDFRFLSYGDSSFLYGKPTGGLISSSDS